MNFNKININEQNNNQVVPNWHDIARPEQRIPNTDKWLWLILAGRGFGKTRTGAEAVMELVNRGKYKSIAIVGKWVLNDFSKSEKFIIKTLSELNTVTENMIFNN